MVGRLGTGTHAAKEVFFDVELDVGAAVLDDVENLWLVRGYPDDMNVIGLTFNASAVTSRSKCQYQRTIWRAEVRHLLQDRSGRLFTHISRATLGLQIVTTYRQRQRYRKQAC